MTCKIKLLEVTDDTYFPFVWKDPTPGGSNLGRAEFIVCINFKRGKMVEYWVYASQQRNAYYAWHRTNCNSDFAISSYHGLSDAKVWLVNYCKVHKTMSLRIYAPTNSAFLNISRFGLEFYRTNPNNDIAY